MLLSNILQSLTGTINSIWVGRLIGEDALAATANANIIMFLVAGAAFGFGMAATVKIGQRFGARDIDGARRTFGTAVGLLRGADAGDRGARLARRARAARPCSRRPATPMAWR